MSSIAMGNLHRDEVLQKQWDRLHGEVLIRPRITPTLAAGAVFLWLLLAATFLAKAGFARTESVRGWVEPDAGVVEVLSPGAGKVARLLVASGDEVAKGQPLVQINGDRVLPDGRHVEDILLEEYASQQRTIERAFTRLAEKAREEQQSLAARIALAQQRQAWINAQRETLEHRMTLLRSRREAQQSLHARGLVSGVELDFLREQELDLKSQFEAVSAHRVNLEGQLDQLRASQLRLAREAQAERDELTLKESNLAQAVAKLKGQRSYLLTAAVRGTVAEIRTNEGEYTQGHTPLIDIVPHNSTLVVKLLAPTRASGFLQPGQRTRIRYDAFPHEKFGSHAGTLSNISRTISTPGSATRTPVALREPAYIVTVMLEREEMLAHGRQPMLRPGMTLSADIVLEERSVLEWLLEPLLTLRG